MFTRTLLCLTTAILLGGGTAQAQSDEYKRLASEWTELYKRYSDSPTTFNQRDYEERQKLWPRMEELQRKMSGLNVNRVDYANNEVGQIEQKREKLTANTDYFNNVSSLRNKDSLDQWVDARRKVWNAENGRRIGIINPYTGEEYYRYYDEKGGTLVVSKVRGGYELLERQRADWEQSYKRTGYLLDAVQGDIELLRREFGEATAIKAKYALAMRPSRPIDPTPRPDPQPTPPRTTEAIATNQEKSFVGKWNKGSGSYTFLAGGKGEIRYDDNERVSTFTWQYHGVTTITKVPTREGGREGSWKGQTIRWWFGNDPGVEKSYQLAIYNLDGREILVPSPYFYDGRDWYSRSK